jgi:hypothetical protein
VRGRLRSPHHLRAHAARPMRPPRACRPSSLLGSLRGNALSDRASPRLL